MGVGVSSWQLARAVARMGQLGVVSGTALAVTVARRLAAGDPGGHVSRALERFPIPEVARRVRDRHLDTRGRTGDRFRAVPRPTMTPGDALTELTVVAGFVEVALAKEGHDGPIGVNLLEKIQLPTLPTLYGAMLAGVDHVLMGAGVPVRIPGVLDALAGHHEVTLPLDVSGALTGERFESRFEPLRLWGDRSPTALQRPRFLAIISSATLARFLARATSGAPDGFVVETPVAGGHNAPPRGKLRFDEDGAPVYGPRDHLDLEAIVELGLPFWLAGGYATPDRFAAARASGAAGVQIGSAFALCAESGLSEELRDRLLETLLAVGIRVRTDAHASPTGYPFKVAQLAGTLSEGAVAEQRPRRCDLGYLRELYRRPDGRVGYRCSAEPVDDFVAKGGDAADTEGRTCLCNGLVASIGLGQVRADGYVEPPLVTLGDELEVVRHLLADGRRAYAASEVVDYVLGNGPSASVEGTDR